MGGIIHSPVGGVASHARDCRRAEGDQDQFVAVGQRGKTRRFGWQAGYGAFSVSASKAAEVMRYIANQEQHHRKRTFQEEFDERYIWQ
jgi:hypothetical protein